MNRQRVPFLMISLILVMLLLDTCSGPQVLPTPVPPTVVYKPLRPEATPIPLTLTPPTATPLPPTPTYTPGLSNGQYFYSLRSVEFSEELSLDGERGRAIQGFIHLKLVFQPADVVDGSPGLSELWLCYRDHKSKCHQSAGRDIVRGNIENIFVVDGKGQKYNAIFVEEEVLVFIVPKDDRSFTLHFLDFPILELQ